MLYPSLSPTAAAGAFSFVTLSRNLIPRAGVEKGGGKVGAEKRCATRISREGDTERRREKEDEPDGRSGLKERGWSAIAAREGGGEEIGV